MSISTQTPAGKRSPAGTPDRTVPQPRKSFGHWFRDKGWRHLVGVVMGVFALFPLAYVLSAALSPTGTLVSANGLFTTVQFDNFVDLFSDPQKPFAKWFVNTLVVGLVTSAGTVFLGALAAYSFSPAAGSD
jgi:arabinogalactan oligomer/maltooligosaccharide transport system permease protein